jgi:hypothetical protein
MSPRVVLIIATAACLMLSTWADAAPRHKKHKAVRHWQGYGFLPGYRPPPSQLPRSSRDRRNRDRAYWERDNLDRRYIDRGYWYGDDWYWYGRPGWYRGRWNGGSYGPCWTDTPIGPMWNCG